MRQINKIIIHCSATPDDRDIGFQEINRGHLLKGWKSPSGVGCGYNFLIRRNGTIEIGRTVDEIGAHVEGANSDSIGVCLIGIKDFKPEQFASLKRLLKSFAAMYPKATLHAHNEFASAKAQGKTCPNFDVKVFI